MARILWAGHGQNVANITRTLSHRVFDGDLTGTGRQQAAALAERLAVQDIGIGQVVSSTLRRARQTAEIIAARLRLPVAAELDELRELNVGGLDGRSDPGAWAAYDAVLAAWTAGQGEARFPGGEDYAELCAAAARHGHGGFRVWPPDLADRGARCQPAGRVARFDQHGGSRKRPRARRSSLV